MISTIELNIPKIYDKNRQSKVMECSVNLCPLLDKRQHLNLNEITINFFPISIQFQFNFDSFFSNFNSFFFRHWELIWSNFYLWCWTVHCRVWRTRQVQKLKLSKHLNQCWKIWHTVNRLVGADIINFIFTQESFFSFVKLLTIKVLSFSCK